jgi:hypothetical protein
MSASPDTGDLAAVLRQLVALAGDHPAEETPVINGADQKKGIEGKARETEKIQPANPCPASHHKDL